MAVAFLPLAFIRMAFVAFEVDPLTQQSVQLQGLVAYYKATWLDGEFPPRMWNVHAEGTRTNNRVEGWHSRLNKAIGCHHPNTHRLVDSLKVEQAATEMTVTRARLGEAPPPRRRRYRRLDRRLDRLRGQYGQGLLTIWTDDCTDCADNTDRDC